MIPKFKAWHKAEKVMCDVSTISFDSGAFLVGVKKGEDEIGDKYFIPAPTDGRFCEFEEFELLQYTGLKDKNGKEIYEGDVIFSGYQGMYYGSTKFIIEFYDGCFGGIMVEYANLPIELPENSKYKHTRYSYFYPLSDLDEGFDPREIIGNRFENPELLK